MFRWISMSLVAWSSSVALAENGLGYSEIFSCHALQGVVRFDSYLGSGHGLGHDRNRIQVVVQGEFVSLLKNAGIFPTQQSSDPGEFLIDGLEVGEPRSDFDARSGATGRSDVHTIALNKEQGALVVVHDYGFQRSTVVLTGLQCP